MAASPTAYLFYGVLLDDQTFQALSDLDVYMAAEEALEKLGVVLLFYGETPHERLALALDQATVSASSGRATEVTGLKVGKSWDKQLGQACEYLKLSAQKPAWFVTSRVSW